jgi:hypothetical protein
MRATKTQITAVEQLSADPNLIFIKLLRQWKEALNTPGCQDSATTVFSNIQKLVNKTTHLHTTEDGRLLVYVYHDGKSTVDSVAEKFSTILRTYASYVELVDESNGTAFVYHDRASRTGHTIEFSTEHNRNCYPWKTNSEGNRDESNASA